MKLVRVKGGKLLEGDVYIQGSKNSALGVIVASLLSKSRVIIQNVPKIQDVFDILEIIKLLNVQVEFINNILIVDSSKIVYSTLKNPLIKKMRASSYFMGLLLSLFLKCEIENPGGCDFGSRPIDMHLDFFESVGVVVRYLDEGYYLKADKLKATRYRFKNKSVGASINALLLSSSIEDEMILENISIEPEVLQVIEALVLMGVDIHLEKDTCYIKGRVNKHGFMISLISDRIEAGTYALMAAAIGKEIRIHNVEIDHLRYLLDLFDKINVKYKWEKKKLTVYRSKELKGIEIETSPYPGFPTDLQQPLTVLLCISKENSVIKEQIYKDRTSHIYELNKMGANIKIKDNCFYIEGNKRLSSCNLKANDLRGGASLIFASLLADGESKVLGLQYVERGYSYLIENLLSLGADIDVEEI